VEYKGTPLEVASSADVVSVHLALTKETRGCINAEFFNSMRPGAFFINTSRGEMVDHQALLDAIGKHGIRAGLDVFAGEPATGIGQFADPITREAGVYGTHHIGASTAQAQEAIAAETVRIIQSFKETGRVPNAVNMARRTPATFMLTVRHLDRPGVLAKVLDAISNAHINVQEMENIVFDGAHAAVARINLEAAPSGDVLTSLRIAVPEILELSLTSLAG
jgi:D-3-phosphoglycerate dehydrogenase